MKQHVEFLQIYIRQPLQATRNIFSIIKIIEEIVMFESHMC